MSGIIWRVRLMIGVAVVGAVCVARPIEVTAQRSDPPGRTPFQHQLTAEFHATVASLNRRFSVPTGRRLEILNVNVRVSLVDMPQHIFNECTVSTPGQPGISTALPFLLRRAVEPLAGATTTGLSRSWVAAQPTLLHAFDGQRITCFMERYPTTGFGFVTWTFSGFSEPSN
jgi:hypothetical protein